MSYVPVLGRVEGAHIEVEETEEYVQEPALVLC